MRDLGLPYSVSALPEDKLPEGAHRIGECPDPAEACLVCRVFGSLNQPSRFKVYTPPLVNDPDHKLTLPLEVNHVLIRTHARNVHRADGNTLNFNQQYFAGILVTYLTFLDGLPDPVALGFLFNCLEGCTAVGAAKTWGAGRLVLQAYTLEQAEHTYVREWDETAYHLTLQETCTPLKPELDAALHAYEHWLASLPPSPEAIEAGEMGT